MTIGHFILRYAHISMGLLALVTGAASMVLIKGSARHRRAGQVFVVAMLIMAGSGAYISGYITPDMANVMGGLLTLYLVITAWATVWREPGRTGVLEVCAAALGLATATVGISSGLRALASPTGLLDGLPAPFFFVFGGIALLGTALDVRMVARGGVTGAARTTRHLWRMLTAMWIATASFFLGQATLFPAAVRKSGVLTIPVLLVLASLLYWLVRVRVVPLVRKSTLLRRAIRAR